MKKTLTSLSLAAALLCPVLAFAASAKPVTAADLAALAPDADPAVLALGLKAMQCAQRGGIAPDAHRLAVIDYGRSSRQPRLWVFDLDKRVRLYREAVAHGKNSGEDVPTKFSNVEGSLQTSLGLFVTANSYVGANGYSMRLQGLEPGINDAAMTRAIVMHGAPYVDLKMAEKTGRLGRSWGCPAVRPEISRKMIDDLRDGQFLFAYYPEKAWQQKSALLACDEGGGATESIASR
jgi:hypothetical protein